MQGHRHEDVGAVENFASCPVHPPPESAGNVGVVGMFQPKDETAAVFVVAQNRAGPVPGSPLASAVAAHRILAHRVRKWQTAAGAPRRREEGDAAPAAPAQRIRLFDGLAAGKATRRQHDIDETAADPPQMGNCCRGLHRHT